MSSIIDYKDRATCIIFGDGAGAIMLEPSQDEDGIHDAFMRTDGRGWEHLHQKAGGSRRTPTIETIENREHYVYQEGAVVFKHAVTGMAQAAEQILERNNLKGSEIDWLVPHQANLRIIDATAQKMGLPSERVMITIDRYGNTTNGTLPFCLRDYEHQLKKGQKVIFAAFGGGFSWGALYATWAYDSPQK